MNDDSTIVIACVAGATVITLVSQVVSKNSHVNIKPVIGGFVVGTLLLGVGLWSPDVAKAFSVVLLATTLVVNGTAVFGVITNVTKKGK
jgi:hypothetical protein